MTIPKKYLKWLLILCLFMPVVALAQTNEPPAQPGFDEKAIKFFSTKFSYWQGMLLPIALVLTTCVKKWVKFIPDNALPFVAPIIGGLLDMAATKLGIWTGNVSVGLAMGGLATWFHQAYIQNKSEETETPAT